MSWLDHSGRRVLVTGAAGGLGLEIARRFTVAGASVAMLDRDPAVRSVADEIGAVTGLVADVQDNEATVFAITQSAAALGGIDVLVNNAGIEIAGPLMQLDEADLARIFDVNVMGTFRCTQAALSFLTEAQDAAVVNISSAAGTAGSPLLAGYSMAKAAVIRMTEALAFEMREAEIRFNAICPALTGPTRMVDALVAPFAEMGLPLEMLVAKQGRMGEAGEIADLVTFLASSDAALVNGAHYLIDGGLTAGVM